MLRFETSIIFKNKKREYLKEKIKLEMKSNKNVNGFTSHEICVISFEFPGFCTYLFVTAELFFLITGYCAELVTILQASFFGFQSVIVFKSAVTIIST
jgi:hypothetical protein